MKKLIWHIIFQLRLLTDKSKVSKALKNPKFAILFLLSPIVDAKLKKTNKDEEILGLKNSIGLLNNLIKFPTPIIDIEDFQIHFLLKMEKNFIVDLGKQFNHFGSDKSSKHNYELIYEPILNEILSRKEDPKIIEIGLGSNHLDVKSNMGLFGKPGASLRAFSASIPNAKIIGADIDRRILFQEGNISTRWTNQLDREALIPLFATNPDFDLFIDDGLHTVEANLNSFVAALQYLKERSWIVIEDLGSTADSEIVSTWSLVSALLGPEYESRIIKSKISLIFVARRIS